MHKKLVVVHCYLLPYFDIFSSLVKYVVCGSLSSSQFSLNICATILFYFFTGLQISGLQVADSADRLYNFLEGENRLDPPNHCPRSIYNLMLRCWNLEPKERPLFDSIVTELHALVNPQYHQTYDDRVRRLGEQHVTIQNKLYQLMTSENHIFPGNMQTNLGVAIDGAGGTL